MKALYVGNPDAIVGTPTKASGQKFKAGFSTLEMMIAFAIMSLVLGGVVLANFGAQYWVVTAQTSNEALYKAKTRLEELRGLAKQDFHKTSSVPLTRDNDAGCLSGSLCYFIESVVVDLSTCSKYAQAKVSWQVQSYPTTTTSLFTELSNPAESILLGGDCILNAPAGEWSDTPDLFFSHDFSGGNPTGLDTLDQLAYLSTDQSPYLKIAIQAGFVAFTNGFSGSDPLNAIDAARDAATGRTYTYVAVASTTGQLQVIDVTDRDNPTQEGVVSLQGVTSVDGKGWRVTHYDRKAYITTLYTGQLDLHIIDVGNPSLPVEIGNALFGDYSQRDSCPGPDCWRYHPPDCIPRGSTRHRRGDNCGCHKPREHWSSGNTQPARHRLRSCK